MSEYTPTVDEVRDRYADARVGIGEWTRFDESVKRAVEEAFSEFDRMIAEVERAAAEKALTDAADDWESGTVEYDEIKRSSDAPLGWSDESVADAVMCSGPVMDWLRKRAATYRREEA